MSSIEHPGWDWASSLCISLRILTPILPEIHTGEPDGAMKGKTSLVA